MNTGDLNKVWEIKPLKKPGEDEARKILDKIAKQVQPIMKKHKWRVKLLSEFSPSNPSLLGLNVGGGVEVKLRLRRSNRDWDFIHYDEVLDTMLHELCHNDIAPHNATFYKLWDDLRKECEELMSKGISGTGEGFDCPGKRLGGFTRQPPLPLLRQSALAAAEKRARIGSLLPSGPKRLGGDKGIMGVLSPLQAAAMAAERRMQDELWCGSQASGVPVEVESSSDVWEIPPPRSLPGESSKCSSDSATHSSDRMPGKKSHVEENFGATNNVVQTSTPDSLLHNSITDGVGIEERSFWECEICTLFNPPLARICEACGIEKPKDARTKFKIWSCKFCTLENSVKLEKCSACGQWRYSYGDPVSSRLNLDT
ncbi:hypothetical protein AQUCO_04900088v1 [Aquilegia coerulea]|uniref:WLM domain-containing protein n=1 Tax=Aquilegia coerulea TaxID=218851 RepID=A0A2G5CJT0_AQUCA|nr:hypothetical protein AQUCO_04900088v1 [Aquilegia coerulea]